MSQQLTQTHANKKKNRTRALPAKTQVKIEFVAGSGAPFDDDDAKVLGPLLERLAAKHGTLSKKILLEEAEQDADSPLRKFFQWDDAKAARKYRLIQAGRLLQYIKYQIETPEGIIEERVFRSVVVKDEIPDAPPGRAWVHTSTIVQHDSLMNQILERALKEAQEWKARYVHHQRVSLTLKPVFDAIDSLEKAQFGKK